MTDNNSKKEEKPNFFTNLKKFLASSVVIKYSDDTQKIKTFDINALQTVKNVETNRLIDKYFSLYKSGYNLLGDMSTTGFSTMRADLYRNYEILDQDPIISAVLDLIADEGSLSNEYGEIIAVKSDKEYIQATLENLLFDVLNIEFNLPWWIRNIAKYGDFFMKLDIVESVGITNCIPLSVYGVERKEDFNNPSLVKFAYDDALATNLVSYSNILANIKRQTFEQYEIAHFRLLADSNYLPYGRSYIEGARKVWNQLTLMIDAMMLQRVMRAPERRVFKIDVGNLAPEQVPAHMEKIIMKLKKTPYMDEKTGQWDNKFLLQSALEDYYLPVRGDKSGTTIETLPGMQPPDVKDLEFLEQRLYTALKVPKAFLANEESVNSRATVSAQDLRFARTIDRFHKIIVSELTKICVVHLYTQGYRDEDLIDFELEMFSPSSVYQLEKVELLDKKTDLAVKMKETKLFSDKWIYNNIYNISDSEAAEEEEGIIYDLKKNWRHDQIGEGSDPAKDMKISASDFGEPSGGGGPSGGKETEETEGEEGKETEEGAEEVPEAGAEEVPEAGEEAVPEEKGKNPKGEESPESEETPESSIDASIIDQEEEDEQSEVDSDIEKAKVARERMKKKKKTAKSVTLIGRKISSLTKANENNPHIPAHNRSRTTYGSTIKGEGFVYDKKKMITEHDDSGTFMSEDNLKEV